MDLWTLKMAWRDSRRGRGRLLLFASALTLGVAALVAIGSLRDALERAIDTQARALVGADLVLEGRQRPDAAALTWEKSLGGEQAHEVALATMARFPKSDGARLVQARALDGNYPFYGRIETEPAEAAESFRAGRGALIEEGLQLQFNLQPGDVIEIGGKAFPVLGAIRKLPGEAAAFSGFAPRVLIPRADLPENLLGLGSLANWKTYFRLPDTTDVPALIGKIQPQLAQYRMQADDVAHRKRALGRVFENVARFLNLVGFVALLLGGIGVASAIAAHVKGKLRTVATLRCLGASSWQALMVYLIQALAIGAAGALCGAVLGLLISAVVPRLLAGVLPVSLEFQFSPAALGQGIGVGLLTCVLFALLPLLPVRRVPPLLALRAAFDVAGAESSPSRRRDPLAWLAFLALGAAVVAFPVAQSGGAWRFGLGFSGALLVAFALLAAVARALIWAARRFLPARWPYAWRQGVANLYRPNNRTLLLTFTLGLSTFLLLGLDLTKAALLQQFSSPQGGSNGPNLVFFDIGSDQQPAVADLARTQGLAVLEDVPVVQMHLASLKGEPVEKLLRERKPDAAKTSIPEWRLRHEYRSTFRDHLTTGEEITGGHWVGHVNLAKDAPVPVSIEAEAARELHLKAGDALVFDLQGVLLPAVIGSVRKVEWGRFQPNFFFVFPTGSLVEEAPAFHVLVTRASSPAQSGAAQAAVVKKFPNVAAIDLSLIVQTVQGIVDKATTAVRFLSIFTVGTGLLVLAAAILTGRYERIRESVLLRTLGASRRQVFTVLVVEYVTLGLLAALTGAVLAAAGSWVLEKWVFQIPWALPPLPMALSVVLACALTVGIGLLASRGVCDHPPLEILRAEE